jgi:hypothetical protein
VERKCRAADWLGQTHLSLRHPAQAANLTPCLLETPVTLTAETGDNVGEGITRPVSAA